MADMDAAEASSNLGQAHRSHPTSAAPLPGWVPPVCAVMFGVAVALQGPRDAGLGLAYPLAGLALALGAWALIANIRARQGARRPHGRTWVPVVVGVGVIAASHSVHIATSELRWLYIAMGVAVAGVVLSRLQKEGR